MSEAPAPRPKDDEPRIHPTADLKNCRLGRSAEVKERVILRDVSLGDFSYIERHAEAMYADIGKFCSIAANTRINKDIPPYFLVSEFDAAAHGLNIVGLRRAGFTSETLTALKQAYRLLYRSALTREESLARIEALNTPETKHLAAFIRTSKRGICPDYRATQGSHSTTNSPE